MAAGFTKGKALAAVIGAGVGFYLVNRGAEFLRAHLAAGDTVSDKLLEFPGWLFGSLARISDNKIDLIVATAAAVLILLIALYNMTTKTNTRRGEEHGSAA